MGRERESGASLTMLIASICLVAVVENAFAQSTFTPRDESPEQFAAGSGPRRDARLYRLPQFQAGGGARA